MPRVAQTPTDTLRKVQEKVSREALPYLRDGDMAKLQPYAAAIGHIEHAITELEGVNGSTAEPKE